MVRATAVPGRVSQQPRAGRFCRRAERRKVHLSMLTGSLLSAVDPASVRRLNQPTVECQRARGTRHNGAAASRFPTFRCRPKGNRFSAQVRTSPPIFADVCLLPSYIRQSSRCRARRCDPGSCRRGFSRRQNHASSLILKSQDNKLTTRISTCIYASFTTRVALPAPAFQPAERQYPVAYLNAKVATIA